MDIKKIKDRITIINFDLNSGDITKAIESFESILNETHKDIAHKIFLIRNQYLRLLKKRSLNILDENAFSDRSTFIKNEIGSLLNQYIDQERLNVEPVAEIVEEREELPKEKEEKPDTPPTYDLEETYSDEELKLMLTDYSNIKTILQVLRKKYPNHSELIILLSEYNHLKKEIFIGIKTYTSPEFRMLIFKIIQFIDSRK